MSSRIPLDSTQRPPSYANAEDDDVRGTAPDKMRIEAILNPNETGAHSQAAPVLQALPSLPSGPLPYRFRSAIQGSHTDPATGHTIGFIIESPYWRGFSRQQSVPMPVGISIIDETPLRKRGANERLTSSGWTTHWTFGDDIEVPSCNRSADASSRTTGHPKATTLYCYAIRHFVSVRETQFPGTRLNLPAQEFRYIATDDASDHPDKETLSPGYSVLEVPPGATERSQVRVRPQVVTHEALGFYRFKVPRSLLSSATDKTGGNPFEIFSVFVPAAHRGALQKANFVAHGLQSKNQPTIPQRLIEPGLEISYFGQPGKILSGAMTDIETKLPFVTIKFERNGLCLVKRSNPAKALNTYQKLFGTEPGDIPNLRLGKYSGNLDSMAVSEQTDAIGVRRLRARPGIMASLDKNDLSAIGSLSERTNSIVATPRRNLHPGMESDVQSAIEMVMHLNSHNGGTITNITVFACMAGEQSAAAGAARNAERRAIEHMRSMRVTDWRKDEANLRTLMDPPFPENSTVRYQSFPADQAGSELQRAVTADVWHSRDLDEAGPDMVVESSWELVGPDGRFLPDTEENRAKVLAAQQSPDSELIAWDAGEVVDRAYITELEHTIEQNFGSPNAALKDKSTTLMNDRTLPSFNRKRNDFYNPFRLRLPLELTGSARIFYASWTSNETITAFRNVIKQYNLAYVRFLRAINGSERNLEELRHIFGKESTFFADAKVIDEWVDRKLGESKAEFINALPGYLCIDIVRSPNPAVTTAARVQCLELIRENFDVEAIGAAFEKFNNGFKLNDHEMKSTRDLLPSRFAMSRDELRVPPSHTGFIENHFIRKIFGSEGSRGRVLLDVKGGMARLKEEHPYEAVQTLIGLMRANQTKASKKDAFECLVALSGYPDEIKAKLFGKEASYRREFAVVE